MVVGLVLIVVGLVLLFVPIPQRVRHGVQAGPISLGVETTERERVHPGISALLIAGGVVMMVAGRKR